MSITHAELLHELQHVKLGTRLLGYNRKAVRLLLEQLATSYEDTSHQLDKLDTLSGELAKAVEERDELRQAVSELEHDPVGAREIAQLVQDTLAAAQRAAEDIRAAAKHEAAELRCNASADAARTVEAARAESRKMAQRARLHEECRAVSAELRGLEDGLAPPSQAQPAAG